MVNVRFIESLFFKFYSIRSIHIFVSLFQAFSWFNRYLQERLSSDWAGDGRSWVRVETMGSSEECCLTFRIYFFDELGQDANVFAPPTAVSVLSDIRNYLRVHRACPYSLYIEDLGNDRRAYRVGVHLMDPAVGQALDDSGCEDGAGQ